MLRDFTRALGQIGDPRFLRVLGFGLALSLGALAGLSWAVLAGSDWLLPETATLPFTEYSLSLDFLSWGALALAVVLSVFLMVPVALLFVGFFLDMVADAVEARHYAHLPKARPVPLAAALADGLRFFGLMVLLNAVALVVYLLSTIFAPVVFWVVNGFLIGREYFHLVAGRRLGNAGARDLRRRHAGQVWLAGALLAVPLTVPVVNLLVPVLAVAFYTHMSHRLAKRTG